MGHERGSDPTFDRRRFPRVDSDALIALKPLTERIALAHALDVSLGGVRVQCAGLAAQPGELLRVGFGFAERNVAVVGQCVRVEPLGDDAQELALQFLKMGEDTRQLLERNLPLRRIGPADGQREEGDDARLEFARVVVEAVVSVTRASMLDVVAQARNVSAGGVHFVVEGLDVALGDVLRVTLSVAGEPVQVVGQLVRVTDIGDGKQEAALAFLDVPADLVPRLRP